MQHCVAVATQLPDGANNNPVIFTHLSVAELLDKVGHAHQQHRDSIDWTAEFIDKKWAEFCSKTEHPHSIR